ncbi:MAG TPA: EAL domain-containing protein [Brevibacterium ravenspurgense]|nr:EAL domain-containing protein [Brevibacterium ravenspurgense]
MTHDANAIGGPDLEELVRSGGVRSLFSPVVDVITGMDAGYRVRHSADTDATPISPQDLRRAVRDSHMVGDIDSSIREQTLRDAEAAGLESHTRLFVNAEPESLVTLEDRTDRDARIILQLDPLSIAAQPGSVLRSVRSARQLGWSMGISGVGLDLATTAYLPLVNPAVVALHPGVLKIEDKEHLAKLNMLLRAHVERTGAVVVAEGVDSEDDLIMVNALGARFATGELYAEPTEKPNPVTIPPEDALSGHYTRNKQIQGTPYSIALGLQTDPLVVDYDFMIEHMVQLLQRASSAGSSALVVGVFGEEEKLPDKVEQVYRSVGRTAGLAAVLSGGFEESPMPSVRSGPVDHSDALRDEYAVIVVGPDWSSMVSAHRRNELGSDGRREFDLFITTERYTSVDAARSVLSRIRLQKR